MSVAYYCIYYIAYKLRDVGKESKKWVLMTEKIRKGPQFKWHLSWVGMNDRISVHRERGRQSDWSNSVSTGRRGERALRKASTDVPGM